MVGGHPQGRLPRTHTNRYPINPMAMPNLFSCAEAVLVAALQFTYIIVLDFVFSRTLYRSTSND